MICLSCGKDFGSKRKFNFVRECPSCRFKHEKAEMAEISMLGTA
ncbi:MAG: hypothetical protein ACTSO9_01045 [Candidatus Helarchaeota archaeon]